MLRDLRALSLCSLILGSLFLAACGSEAPLAPTTDAGGVEEAGDTGGAEVAEKDLAVELERYLTGRFDSVTQAKADLSYFEIQLQTCKVEAPALGAHVLYVEQARMDTLSAPYRQRLYVIEKKGAGAVSRVFELVSPVKAKGLCKDPSRIAFDPTMVTERAGCAVVVNWETDRFVGGTNGRDCPSDLSGATYATSEVTIDAAGMKSWDRGFDDAGVQKWGATKGGYVFERRTPLP
ncbi:MAG: chromophore lyase CpcT/CpeT [Myxococcales bacterium]|nr:chromophore lyase CpcT/CpeT [Myxococcales bacterium]